MAIRPFANAPHADKTAIATNWLIGVQTGNTPNAVTEMKYLTFEEFTDYIKSNYGAMWNYRGESSSATPTDPEVNDYFICTGSFTEGGQSFVYGHMYAYNGNTWDDVSLVLNQYAQQSQVDDIDGRLVVAEEKIDALSGFIFKGDTTRAELPDASASNQGWVYYLTDENIYVASDGSDWVTVMNYVVQTVTEGDTGHAPSGDAVYKALAQRDAKDADLQSQIVNTNAELDNVEALIGGDVEVVNTDPAEGESLLAQSRLIHHTNLLPNGDFGRVGARAVKWKQFVKDGDFSADTYWRNNASSYSTVTIANGQAKQVFNSTPPNWYDSGVCQVNHAYKIIQGHYYLFLYEVRTTKSVGAIGYVDNIGTFSPKTISPNVWTRYEAIKQASSTGTVYNFILYNNNSFVLAEGDILEYRNAMLFDLTAMNEYDSTLTDAQNIARFCSKFPASYYPDDEGHIYDLNPSGFRIVDKNKIDINNFVERSGYTGQWTLTQESNGIKFVGGSSNGRFVCFNIPLVVGQSYTISGTVPTGGDVAYDQFNTEQTNIMGSGGTHTYSLPVTIVASKPWLFVQIQFDWGATYPINTTLPLQVEGGSSATSYEPYMASNILTPQIADGHYVNEDCYDYVENVVEDGVLKGKKHTKVGSINLGDVNWSRRDDGLLYSQTAVVADALNGTVNVLCPRYLAPASGHTGTSTDEGHISNAADGFIYVKDNNFNSAAAFKTAMQNGNVYYYYELKEEVVTDCEPLRSFDISDYSTVEPITSQDELVNRIDVPYSIKTVSANTIIERIEQNAADIAQEIIDRQNADANLQTQIINVNKAVENLDAIIEGEDKIVNIDPAEGQSIMAQSRLIHHANLLPNGKFGRVGARDVAINQLQYNGNFASSDGWYNGTVSNGYIEGSANANSYWQPFNSVNKPTIIQGHIYYIRAKLKAISGLASGTTTYNLRINGSSSSSNAVSKLTTSIPNGTSVILEGLHTANANTSGIGVTPFWGVHNDTNNFVAQWSECMIIDLTAMGMDSLTADKFRALFPASYYPYTTGKIVNLNPSGFRIRGVNLWDEEWEVGNIQAGSPVSSTQYFRSKNFIKVDPSVAYYLFSGTNDNIYVFEYLADLSYANVVTIIDSTNHTFTPSANTRYVRFADRSRVAYANNIQICLDSLPTSIKTTYHPYDGRTVDTPQISDGHYVNENCYDYVENVVEDGVLKGKKHSVVELIADLSLLNWVLNTSGQFYAVLPVAGVADTTGSNVLCTKYRGGNAYGKTDKTICVSGTTSVAWVCDLSISSATDLKTVLNGAVLYYEKRNPTITDCDPIHDFSISDYSTVEPITPQTELVNRIDVPFSVVTESDNGIVAQVKANTEAISAEVATRSAQVSALSKRVTNLELKTGDQFDVDYPSDTYGMDGVPAGVEPYAKVKRMRGVSVAWNQQMNDYPYNASVSKNGSTITVTWNNSTGDSKFGVIAPTPRGHVAFISVNIVAVSVQNLTRIRFGNGLNIITDIGSHTFLAKSSNSDSIALFADSSSLVSGDNFVYKDFVISDLTQMFGSSVADYLYSIEQATTGAGVALFKALVSAQDNSHETGELVSTTYSAVKSIHKNLVDNSTNIAGAFWTTGGVVYSSDYATSAKIPVVMGETYIGSLFNKTTKARVTNLVYATFDSLDNNNAIRQVTASTITINAGEKYVAVRNYQDDASYIIGNNYVYQLERGSTATSYSPYGELDSLPLPTSVTLRGILKVQNNTLVVDGDEYDPEAGEIERNFNTIKLDDYTWTLNSENTDYLRVNVSATIPKAFENGQNINNFDGTKWKMYTTSSGTTENVLDIRDSLIIINIAKSYLPTADVSGFNTWCVGKEITYERATPTSDTPLAPVLDPFIHVEGGGTVDTTQTNDPHITSAMTVEYMAQ